METEISPRPWRMNEHRLIVDANGKLLVGSAVDDGHYMIRAVNSFDDLLAACEFALMTIEHREGLSHRKDLFTDDERDKLRAAIAKARGEK